MAARRGHHYKRIEDPKFQAARRSCLRCNHGFNSLSRFNRICKECKEALDRARVVEALSEGFAV